MKVLQVLSSLNRLSGVANVVMNYYRMLNEKVTFDFLLYGDVEDSFVQEAENYGSKIYYISKFNIKTYGKYKKEIDRFFDEHCKEYDIVHVHELMSQRVIIKNAHKHGLKVIIHSHGPYPDRKMVGILKAIRNRFLLSGFDKNADFYLACSEHAGTAFKHQKNVTILKNGVDVKRYINGSTMRSELGISDKTFAVGCVGRITEQKNPAGIIDIFARVYKQNNDSVLIMAGSGDGDSLGIVKSRIREYGLDGNVKLIGNCKTVPQLMRSLDAFFMPSLWEGLPVVLVEAQAAGLPCFCSENIPKEGNLTGNTQFISLDTDYSVWADNILSGRKISEEQVKQGFVKTGYDLGENAETLLTIYRKVINGSN